MTPDDWPCPAQLTGYEKTVLAELEAGARRRIKRRRWLVYLPRALATAGLGNLGARLIQAERWTELAILVGAMIVFAFAEWVER